MHIKYDNEDWDSTLETLAQLPLFILQYRISPSLSQEQIKSSLFGWKSSDITAAECPVKVRSEYPGCTVIIFIYSVKAEYQLGKNTIHQHPNEGKVENNLLEPAIINNIPANK